MTRVVSLMSAAALGAGLMFLFDPQRGRTRRAMIRDKAVRARNDTEEYVGKKARHLTNKARGLAHEARDAVHEIGSRAESEVSSATSP